MGVNVVPFVNDPLPLVLQLTPLLFVAVAPVMLTAPLLEQVD